MKRKLNKTALFVSGKSARRLEVCAIEGQVMRQGRMKLRVLVIGDAAMVMELFRPKGLVVPSHVHHDHDSASYIIRGKLRVIIGGHEFMACAGDAWYEPAGVEHWSEALTDVLNIEIKSPPTRTW